jgi:hypothetical protein
VLEPISLERKVKYLVVRGVHRLMSMYPYEGAGEAVDRELDASVREREQGLVVAPSLVPGAGMGLFVDRDYEAGEVVCTYIGRCLTLVQMLRTRDWTYMMDCGKDRHGRRVHLDARREPRSKAAYVNHHFDRDKVNVVCDEIPDQRKCLVLASRRILLGEELYMDYGLKYWHIVATPPVEGRADGSVLAGIAAARARG